MIRWGLLVTVALSMVLSGRVATALPEKPTDEPSGRLAWVDGVHPPLASAAAPGIAAQVEAGGDQYVFAMTRALNRMNLHPVWKLTLLPGAIVLDLVLLPLTVLADVAT